MSNRYYNKVVTAVDGQTASAADLEDSKTNIQTGFDLVEAELDDAIRLESSVSAGFDPEISEDAATRAGKLIGFTSDGQGVEPSSTAAAVNAVAMIDDEVVVVSGISGNVTTVAGISANVTTVAGISADTTTVAGISGNVTTVATNNANVTTVAGSIANVNTTAGSIANVNTVAGIAADVSTVAADGADIGTVATNIANVNTVAGVSANVTTVAGIAANVTSVAGIAADVTTAAANVTDITNFADVYIGPSATAPATRTDTSALQAGDLYFNTASGKMNSYTGAAWEEAYVPLSGYVTDTGTQTLTNKTIDYDLNTITNLPASLGLDGPADVYVTQEITYAITNYSVFSEYLVQASAGTVSIAGDTITYTAPGTAQTDTLTVTVDGNATAFSIEILPAGVSTPTNSSPTNGATDQNGSVTLTASAFSWFGLSDTHASSDWQVATDAGFTSLVANVTG
ncbi:MAG: hypothetical protein H7842_02590, partial [Gammaproteobacteria bacterium SHHR-1]